MSDEDSKAIGRIEGTLDSLRGELQRWQADHRARHETIDRKLDSVQADINKAKGGRAMLVLFTGIASASLTHAGSKIADLFK